MSRFLSAEAKVLDPYTPGEQPRDTVYIKLNTNESPFPPSPKVIQAISSAEVGKLNLYSDPSCDGLHKAIADFYGLGSENVIAGNGSDEILAFAFRAFAGNGIPIAFPDISYGFYKVWARLYGLDMSEIPLREDFTIAVEDYFSFPGTVVIANPNAPTGLVLSTDEIERLLQSNPDRVVIIDEAYADFSTVSCVPLIRKYDNLLVTQTMSKSRSLAGGRLGFALGSEELISGLKRIKFSFNPYSVNRLTLLAATAAMEDREYFRKCCDAVISARSETASRLRQMGFTVLDSHTNFIFAKCDSIPGGELYRRLKSDGILVRWFDSPRIRDYVRITVGTMEQMEALLQQIKAYKEA